MQPDLADPNAAQLSFSLLPSDLAFDAGRGHVLADRLMVSMHTCRPGEADV